MHYWTKDIVIDPNDATQNTWYACVFSGWGVNASGLGGLYKTTNRGTNWTKLTGTTIDRVTSMTFNPTNAGEVYLTTEGQGLWVSHNINATTPTFSMVPSYPFQQPERVFFNPYNTSQMWVTSFGNGMKMGTLLSTGIVDFKEDRSGISIYPNPSNGKITVQNTNTLVATIYDTMGKQVAMIDLVKGENNLDLSYLPTGIYFMKVNEGVKKLVIGQ